MDWRRSSPDEGHIHSRIDAIGFRPRREKAGPKSRHTASLEGRHLGGGRLAVNGLAGIFDGAVEGLPSFTNHLLVG
ncbi:hypothetical protein DSM25558_3233 [Agrobacterium sp. DSM 25558]|nr:hypothetical protein DSM25558_3233 [Agrobacterium sp. DSM 25558]